MGHAIHAGLEAQGVGVDRFARRDVCYQQGPRVAPNAKTLPQSPSDSIIPKACDGLIPKAYSNP